MWAWIDGDYIKADELRISPFDHGFLYGLGFFETFRTYGGIVFLLTAHMNRLQKALDEYHLHVDLDKVEISTIVHELNKRSDGSDGYFRLNISAGVHDIGLAPTVYEKPTIIIFRKPLPPLIRGKEKSAVWLETRRNTPESEMRHKSHHYANNVRARLELPSLAEQEGFFLTVNGHVAEGITSNIFWVNEGELFTPSLETGILAGTTRDWVMREAANLGIRVNEGLFGPEMIERADEVFVTNAVQELVPIKRLGVSLYAGAEGEIYSTLHERYVEQTEKQRQE